MARKKAKKTSKKAKKPVRKAAAKRTKTPARRTKKTARKTTARSAKSSRKATGRKAATRKTSRRNGDVKGEGNYSASRRFRKKEEGFIKRMGKKLIGMGQDAKAALDGPQGAELKAAEAETRERGEGMDQA